MRLAIIDTIDKKLLPENVKHRGMIYFVLLYLTLFWSPFFFDPISLQDWVISITGNLVFLYCYFSAYWSKNYHVIKYIVAIILVGCILATISPGASTFFIYAAGFACLLGTVKRAVIAIICINCVTLMMVFVFNHSWIFGAPALFFATMVGGMNIYQRQIDLKNQQIAEGQEQTKYLATLAERERIGRDLHDMLGHTLSVITLKAELTSKLIDKNADLQTIRDEIKQVENLSRETLSQVRDAIKGYRDTTVVAEAQQGKIAAKAANIDIHLDIEELPLEKNINAQLGLIIREGITNIIRHANTSKASVSLKNKDESIELVIEDEGCFHSNQEGTGMISMRTRIEKLGGNMQLSLKPNTQLKFSCPLQ